MYHVLSRAAEITVNLTELVVAILGAMVLMGFIAYVLRERLSEWAVDLFSLDYSQSVKPN